MVAARKATTCPCPLPLSMEPADFRMSSISRAALLAERSGSTARRRTGSCGRQGLASGRVRRPEGASVLLPVTKYWLREQMARAAAWTRTTASGPFPSDPQMQYAQTLLSRGEWRFPELRAQLTCPTIDVVTGRVIQSQGYDAESCLLLLHDGSFPPVPGEPTRAGAQRGLEQL